MIPKIQIKKTVSSCYCLLHGTWRITSNFAVPKGKSLQDHVVVICVTLKPSYGFT